MQTSGGLARHIRIHRLRGLLPGIAQRACMVVAIALAVAFAAPVANAQDAAPQTVEQKVEQLVQLLGDADVQALLKSRSVDPAAAPAVEDPGEDVMTLWLTTINNHLSHVFGAVDDVPAEIGDAASTLAQRLGGSRFLLFALFVAIVFGGGYAADRITRRAMQVRSTGPDTGVPVMGGALSDGLMGRILPLFAFVVAAALLYLALPWPEGSATLVLPWIFAVFVIRMVRAITEFAVAVQKKPAQAATYAYWGKRITRFVTVLIVGWVVVKDLLALNVNIDVAMLVAYAFGAGLIVLAMEMVWSRKVDADVPLTKWRAQNLFFSFWFLLLGVLWIAGMTLLLWVGIYAILFPIVLPLISRFVRTLFDIPENWEQQVEQTQSADSHGGIPHGGEAEPAKVVTTRRDAIRMVLLDRGARIIVIALAMAWVVSIVAAHPSAMMENQTVQRLVVGCAQAIMILLLADLLWQLVKALISSKLAGLPLTPTEPTEIARVGRLRTLLPVLRNVLGVLIGTISVLMALSGLGVAIGPLIAGAGIFGVAIGFGSQTLVKDVLSGVFFMLDDAFRVGEYIQSGSYKGTVESFSIRSVRLRHHRGPIYTVPFGTLGAVQNMSRDWSKDKFMISVPFDTDLEVVRKIVKKVGQELLADPEFGPSFIEPLKMKGVEQFGEYGMSLGFGMMVKPGGQQAVIRRKAYAMIKAAFKASGIDFASPTVQVAGDDTGKAAAALATKRAADMKLAAEQAAAGG